MRRSLSLAVLLCAGGAVAAHAQTFTDQAAWLTALGVAPTTVDFEGMAGVDGFATGPFNISGATFDASGTPFIVDPGYGSAYYDWGTGAVFSPQNG